MHRRAFEVVGQFDLVEVNEWVTGEAQPSAVKAGTLEAISASLQLSHDPWESPILFQHAPQHVCALPTSDGVSSSNNPYPLSHMTQ